MQIALGSFISMHSTDFGNRCCFDISEGSGEAHNEMLVLAVCDVSSVKWGLL